MAAQTGFSRTALLERIQSSSSSSSLRGGMGGGIFAMTSSPQRSSNRINNNDDSNNGSNINGNNINILSNNSMGGDGLDNEVNNNNSNRNNNSRNNNGNNGNNTLVAGRNGEMNGIDNTTILVVLQNILRDIALIKSAILTKPTGFTEQAIKLIVRIDCYFVVSVGSPWMHELCAIQRGSLDPREVNEIAQDERNLWMRRWSASKQKYLKNNSPLDHEKNGVPYSSEKFLELASSVFRDNNRDGSDSAPCFSPGQVAWLIGAIKKELSPKKNADRATRHRTDNGAAAAGGGGGGEAVAAAASVSGDSGGQADDDDEHRRKGMQRKEWLNHLEELGDTIRNSGTVPAWLKRFSTHHSEWVALNHEEVDEAVWTVLKQYSSSTRFN